MNIYYEEAGQSSLMYLFITISTLKQSNNNINSMYVTHSIDKIEFKAAIELWKFVIEC